MHRDRQVGGRRRACAALLCAAVALVLVASACGAAATTPTASSAGSLVRGQMTVNGTTRTYHLLDPSPSDARPKPLVVVLHGGREDGTAMITRTNFDQVAQADGFIVVFPDGVQGHWNSGSCCGAVAVSVSDEEAFFNQLLDQIESRHHVDTSRVYVTGFSAGGYMVYRLACDLSMRFTAAASVSGSMPDGQCTMARPLSILEIHGTADNQLPYAGGVAPGLSDHTPPTVAIVTAWAQRDHCSPSPQSGGTAAVATMSWTGCAAGTQVLLETVAGGGNSWYAPSLTGADAALDATQTVWKFFEPLAAH